MSAPAIRADALTKYYGSVVGIESVTFEVAEGEVFGFLGANGSGKTTTIRLLLDLLRPTSGAAWVRGFDCRRQGIEARRQIGYLPGEMPMYPELTGEAYLAFLGALEGRRLDAARLRALLGRFDVSAIDLRRRMRDYSHGMKRKLGLVQAMMTDAPVLVLDEPTTGLDPLMVEAFCETIDEIARAGRTVFLSSHVLSEVDRLCTRVGLVRNGRLVTVRPLAELRASVPRRLIVRFARPVDGASFAVAGATLAVREPQRWVIDAGAAVGPILTALRALPVADIDLECSTLEHAVLRLLKEDAPC